MGSISLQHVQLFITLLKGFCNAGEDTVSYLDLRTGEFRQREAHLLDSAPGYVTWEVKQAFSQLQVDHVQRLVEKCRSASDVSLPSIPFTRKELLALRMFIRYLLKRAEGICNLADSHNEEGGFSPIEISTAHVLSMPVAQSSSPEEYYPILLRSEMGSEFLLPYTAVFNTRAVFDSICFVVPLMPSIALLFVHTSMHKYFYDGESLLVHSIDQEDMLASINESALSSEMHSGARCIVGRPPELRRLQKQFFQGSSLSDASITSISG